MRVFDLRLMRYSLAIIWLVTGALSLGIYSQTDSLALLGRVGLHGASALFALYASATLDTLLGILTLIRPCSMLWRAQAVLVLGYSIIITINLPEFWLHQFGPILKNLPILMLLWLLYRYEEKSS